jgi:hypothetical protein
MNQPVSRDFQAVREFFKFLKLKVERDNADEDGCQRTKATTSERWIVKLGIERLLIGSVSSSEMMVVIGR